jgi:choice-of-anchor C domain-containing protein
MMRKLSAALAIALLAPLAAHASPNLIADGDFSSPNGGGGFVTYSGGSSMGPWTVTGRSVDLIGGYWQAPTIGGGSVDLDGNAPGGVSQSISTIAGHKYEVSFMLSGNPDGGPATKTLDVSASSASPVFTYTNGANSHGNMAYAAESFTFTATGSSTTIGFASGDVATPYGPVIGEVSVTAANAPEPATFAILGVGLVGVGLSRRRR